MNKKVEHRLLDVHSVEFDPDNPRISEYIATYTDPDPDTIAMALQPGDAKYLELKQAIWTNDGIINPIIVNQLGGRLITVEGNTRLAIYKQFRQENPNDERWQQIPAIVYQNMNKVAIDAVRLQAHLVGVRNWTPYAKAKYLHQLHNDEHLPLNQLVDFCGGNKLEVIRSIEAYKRMEHDYRPLIPDDDFDVHKYSNFYEMQKPTVLHAITKAGFTTKHFAQWVKDGKFEPRQELVRKLPAIISNPRAREVFLEKGADLAQQYIDRPELAKELQNATLVDLCLAVQEKIQNIKLVERDTIRNNEEHAACLEDTVTSLENFYTNEIAQK